MTTEIPEGVKVRFTHGRVVKDDWGLWFRKGPNKEWGRWDPEKTTSGHRTHPAQDIATHGGLTTCELTLGEEKVVHGRAECSGRDRYVKKVGRDISLGRALKLAKKKYPELFELETADTSGAP